MYVSCLWKLPYYSRYLTDWFLIPLGGEFFGPSVGISLCVIVATWHSLFLTIIVCPALPHTLTINYEPVCSSALVYSSKIRWVVSGYFVIFLEGGSSGGGWSGGWPLVFTWRWRKRQSFGDGCSPIPSFLMTSLFHSCEWVRMYTGFTASAANVTLVPEDDIHISTQNIT